MNELCKCGHKLEDHHNPMICDGIIYVDWRDNPNPEEVMFDPAIHKKGEVVSLRSSWYCLENRTDFPHYHGEECEYYGFNETGGLMPLNEDGLPLEWIEDSQGNRHMNEPVWKWIDHCRYFERSIE